MPSDKIIAAGSLRIKALLPDSIKNQYDATKVLNKGGVKGLISDIITHGGKDAPDAVSKVSHLFFNTATKYGYSTPLSDYLNDSEERKDMLQDYKEEVDGINADATLNEVERNEKLNDIADKYGDPKKGLFVAQNRDYMLSKGSTAAKMAVTGARGNPLQLNQGTNTPIMSRKIDGTPIPLAITKSFAEGLSPAEHLAMSYWGRGNTVQAQNSTSKPGDMFKSITPNVYHEVITTHDCGTRNGIMVDLSDKKRVMFHVEAGTNRIIGERTYGELVRTGVKRIKIRSTLTCEAKEGVCQMCYGLNSNGNIPSIGENVGTIAAQSVSEVLTQMILSTKHNARAGNNVSAFDLTDRLLYNPEVFTDEAILAKDNGTVDKIEKTKLDDYDVTIHGKIHFVPKTQTLTVKQGDVVKQGQPISTGMANPRTLTSLRGIGDGRVYMSNQMRKIYNDEGNNLDPRHFDMIAKNLVKYVEVKNPGDTSLLPGDIVTVNALAPYLEKDKHTVAVEHAGGFQLASSSLHLTPGTLLDHNHIDDLVKNGVKTVDVSKSGLSVVPIVPGLQKAKLKDTNWVSKLAFKELKNTLKDAAAQGLESLVSSTDPITPYIIGGRDDDMIGHPGFGEGKNGRY